VGTCGFAGAQARAFAELDLVEIQQTFYEPPRPDTARRWRERAPESFRFTLKAWQLITHPASSPTYRRLRTPLSEAQRRRCGAFRLNDVTRMAWDRTLEIARLLRAEAVVLQTPASFRPTAEHLDNLHRFLSRIDRAGLALAFEPRGEAWTEAILRPLLDALDLIHAVDPFLREPLTAGLYYFRLHGRPAYHYHHRYTDAELARLAERCLAPGDYRVLFNNDAMAEDARRFRAAVRRASTQAG
jgi:uncharacterized protein YecE (DUF72 family)